jgi:hypothetical protein
MGGLKKKAARRSRPRLSAALPRIRPQGKYVWVVFQLRARRPMGSAPGFPGYRFTHTVRLESLKCAQTLAGGGPKGRAAHGISRQGVEVRGVRR